MWTSGYGQEESFASFRLTAGYPWKAVIQWSPQIDGQFYLADLYKNQGKYSEAEPLYRRSITIREKALGKDHPGTKLVRSNLEAMQAGKQ